MVNKLVKQCLFDKDARLDPLCEIVVELVVQHPPPSCDRLAFEFNLHIMSHDRYHRLLSFVGLCLEVFRRIVNGYNTRDNSNITILEAQDAVLVSSTAHLVVREWVNVRRFQMQAVCVCFEFNFICFVFLIESLPGTVRQRVIYR